MEATAALTTMQIPWRELSDAAAAKRIEPALTNLSENPNFYGYHNHQAGWADAVKAIAQLRDDCIEHGVSFICGTAGTVVRIDSADAGRIRSVRTLAGTSFSGDYFVLTAGAWSSSIMSTYRSTISTAQAVGYMHLTDAEMERYKNLPIYINFSPG